jgi:hypothetical protein
MTHQKKPSKNHHRPKHPKQKFPRGWNEARVRRVLEHYENQTEDEAVAEDEAAFKAKGQTVMVVPTELVPKIRQLISDRGSRAKS